MDAMSTGQAARALGVTPKTVRAWIERGAMAGSYSTPQGHYRVPMTTIVELREGLAANEDGEE